MVDYCLFVRNIYSNHFLIFFVLWEYKVIKHNEMYYFCDYLFGYVPFSRIFVWHVLSVTDILLFCLSVECFVKKILTADVNWPKTDPSQLDICVELIFVVKKDKICQVDIIFYVFAVSLQLVNIFLLFFGFFGTFFAKK